MTAAGLGYVPGRATRALLVRAAEELIAEHGVTGVSLREVATAAGQRNTAAVRYHFGDRDGLVAAVFEHRLPAINDRRRRLLDDLRACDRLDDPRGLVEAFALPLIEESSRPDSHYVGFLARLSHHNRASHPFWHTAPTLTDSAEEVLRLLASRVSAATAVLREFRARMVTGFVVASLANHRAARDAALEGTPATGMFVEDMLAVATAMVTAAPAETPMV